MEENKLQKKKEKKPNIHKNHRQRLREELMSTNFNTPHDYKLLEFLLFHCYAQIDTNPIAHRLINKFGSFANVLEASMQDLLSVEGVGKNTAVFIKSYIPICERYRFQKANARQKLVTTNDYVHFFNESILDQSTEKSLLVLLNNKYELIKGIVLENGTFDKVEIDYDKIYDQLKQNNATKLIIMHNHPSGNATPSSEDLTTTEEIYKKLAVLNKTLIDHIIVSSNGHFSFKDFGLINSYEKDLENQVGVTNFPKNTNK